MTIKQVAVIGAGVMGGDVAFDVACYGYRVILKDIDEGALTRTKAAMKETVSLVKMMKKELKQITLEEIMSRISFTTENDGLEGADLVIENITEDDAMKQRVYKELREICRPETYYAMNTSCISVTKIAALLPAPERVIGMHFMNPVPLKKMVEVIRGHATSPETEQVLTDFLKSLNKTPIVVNDFPGFVTNRVLMLTINEAIWTVHDNVAQPKDVDKIFRLGFGHAMGPLATGDLIGLDTILNSLIVLYESYNDPKYRPCPLLRKMVDAGLLGKKSGKGFFKYA